MNRKARKVFPLLVLLIVTSLVLSACGGATEEPGDSGRVLVNAVYYRLGSGLFTTTENNQTATMAHFLWLTPDGTILTFTGPPLEGPVCDELAEIAAIMNESPEMFEQTVARATGVYQIDLEDNTITLSWESRGTSFFGDYSPAQLVLNVNGVTETFVLASKSAATAREYPPNCIYEEQTASIPGPYIDPAPPPMWMDLELYTAVMLQSGMLMLSFQSTDDLPDGEYFARLQGGDGVDRSYSCQVLPDYPQRLYCYGEPIPPGTEVRFNFYRLRDCAAGQTPGGLLNEYQDTRPTELGPLDFGPITEVMRALTDYSDGEVTSVYQAWEVVGTCVQLFMLGQPFPQGCEPYIRMALDLNPQGFETPVFGQSSETRSLRSVGDWEGTSRGSFVMFVDPMIAFVDPIIAFVDPMIAFVDPMIANGRPWWTSGAVPGQFSTSTQMLALDCGDALGVPYDPVAGTYADQVYHALTASAGQDLPGSCNGLLWQCSLTPGPGCSQPLAYPGDDLYPGNDRMTCLEPRAAAIDCEQDDANFYCQEMDPGGEFAASGQACARNIGWSQELRTHGQYSDLLLYLATVTPWLQEPLADQACQDFLSMGMRSMYGISPYAIWGTEGTSFDPFGAQRQFAMPVPQQSDPSSLPETVVQQSGGGGIIIQACILTPKPDQVNCWRFDWPTCSWVIDIAACN